MTRILKTSVTGAENTIRTLDRATAPFQPNAALSCSVLGVCGLAGSRLGGWGKSECFVNGRICDVIGVDACLSYVNVTVSEWKVL